MSVLRRTITNAVICLKKKSSRQLPPLQWSVERHQQPRYRARERPSTLPGIPLVPVARVGDGAVEDLCARKVLCISSIVGRNIVSIGSGQYGKLCGPLTIIYPRRHDLQQNIGNLLPIGHVLE